MLSTKTIKHIFYESKRFTNYSYNWSNFIFIFIQKRKPLGIKKGRVKYVITEGRIRWIKLSVYNLPRHYVKIPLGSQLVCLPVSNVDLSYNLPLSFLLMIWGKNIVTFSFLLENVFTFTRLCWNSFYEMDHQRLTQTMIMLLSL